MYLIWLILIGLAAGWLAGKVMNSRAGLLANLVIGVLGAFLGGFLFRLLGISAGHHLLGTLITAFVGAVVLIALVRLIRKA